MVKNMKKGFTLIELLAVIALIGILVSLSVPNLVKYLDKASNSGMKNQENSITAAANLYIEDHCKNPLYGYICPESYTNPDPGQEKYLCLSDLQDDKNVEEGIKRESYIEAEEKVINELKVINKPFIVVLNSAHPNSNETQNIAQNLRNNYDVPVLPISVEKMSEPEIYEILKSALYEYLKYKNIDNSIIDSKINKIMAIIEGITNIL